MMTRTTDAAQATSSSHIWGGGIVDHGSNMPDPVALSSAEAEYNEGFHGSQSSKNAAL